MISSFRSTNNFSSCRTNMNDIEQLNRQLQIIKHPLSLPTRHKRAQRQRISPSPDPEPNQLSSFGLPHSSQIRSTIDIKTNQIAPIVSPTHIPTLNSVLDHSNMTNQQKPHLPDNYGNNDTNSSNNPPSSTVVHKNNSPSSDLDPFERKKQVALAKAEAKLEKAQRLYQSAQQSVEQNISEFLRVTTIPGILHESKTTNAAYEKRIRTLQETKKELEKKIANYQADILRIQTGDIPQHHSSSKEMLHTIVNKVSSGNSKHTSANDISTPTSNDASILESDNLSNLPSTSNHHNIGTMNTNQNLSVYGQSSNTLEVIRSSPSNSISNEIGNSQFYIDSNYDHFYDRKHDVIVPGDISAIHDIDKSPSTKRRLTDDSNMEFNDRISDHSSDDRFVSYNTSKRNTISTNEHHQLMIKIDFMQKTIDRYDTKMTEMQKQIDSLILVNDSQHEQNERLNNEITDLTYLHQNEMSAMKTDLRKLEEKLLYNFNDYWAEMVEKLDKLDTRTTKVEHNQAHPHETEENTHRIISKFVNILLTVFAIILLLLSTIKNLVQSRVHAVILLILVFTWISIRYLPENYFQKDFITIFKRTS